jgi:hypothetical protein
MMAMPFLVVGAIAAGLIYSYHRAQKNTNADEPQSKTTTDKTSVGLNPSVGSFKEPDSHNENHHSNHLKEE